MGTKTTVPPNNSILKSLPQMAQEVYLYLMGYLSTYRADSAVP
ncbi:hypothetical protein NO393_00055 [Escherichia coli]|nr:hypothetical protein [Escherichia coli]